VGEECHHLGQATKHLGARQAGEVLAAMATAKVRRFGVIFISHELPNALGATNRVVVRRLGTIMRETPALEFTAESMLGTISGLHVAKESFPVAEKSRTALLVRCIN
jgi:simple sugar transport system ATP-binding protein